MGKGSKPRPVDKKRFDSNYDKIFGKKQVDKKNKEKREEKR